MTRRPTRNWLGVVELGGSLGRRCVKDYRESGTEDLIKRTQETLPLLRSGQLDAAFAILLAIRDNFIDGMNDDLSSRLASAPCQSLVGRHYYPALAYYYYCSKDFETAWSMLSKAEQVVRNAIEANSFLLMLAESFIDFTIQKGRIARAKQNWALMWEQLRKVRGMSMNQIPLCTLENGKAIFASTVAHYLSSLPLNDDETNAWREITDDRLRHSIAERLIREVYTLPGFVIDY